MSVITLTTDFGLNDWFVGAMKGVILTHHPRATVIDVTHAIPPGDIRAGAFALLQAAPFYPRRTIHVAVVDPGVGGDREAIVIQTDRALFLGPDNGVLSFAVRALPIRSVRRLGNARLFQHPVSRTFHGRDVFAPMAAHLARGLPLSQVGPRLPAFIRLDWPEPERRAGMIRGRILHIDRFGNAITNVDAPALAALGESPRPATISAGRCRAIPLADCYSAVPVGRPVALVGSTELVEIAVNGGSAADQLRLKIGDPVIVRQGKVNSTEPARRNPLMSSSIRSVLKSSMNCRFLSCASGGG